MTEPMWTPPPERVDASAMADFLRRVAAQAPAVSDYASLHRWSIRQPAEFWSLLWDFCGVRAAERGERTLVDGARMPGARWFPDARLNFAENLLRGAAGQLALVVLDEAGGRTEWSRGQLRAAVARVAAGLRDAGVGVGDRVAGLLPNGAEAVVAMLAATSLGAVWSSCSPDFGDAGVIDRFGQIEPKVLFVTDGYRWKGRVIETQPRLANLLAALPSVVRVVVVPYVGLPLPAQPAGLAAFGEFGPPAPPPLGFAQLPFDHPAYILFSSGTTGKPKCIVHGAGGTLLQHLKELVLHTDLRPGDRLLYFTTCGWMMWNWLASGLAAGATLVLYDGSPFHPGPAALPDLLAREGVTVFGTSAKYIAALEKAGVKPRATHDLSRLRTVLSTGSPLVPESFDYVYRDVKADLQLASISGGTDIVSCFALGCPILPVYRGELQCLGLGMAVDVFDAAGRPVLGRKGELVCRRPFPSMPVGFWNDPDGRRYRAAYFERFPGVWAHGDFAELTPHGGLVIHGRSDAVLNPGGVRIGTAEIYRQVEKLDEVLESLAVGQRWGDDERVLLFVVLRAGLVLDEALRGRIRSVIGTNTTPRHVPAEIHQVDDIPRTRSGKMVELAVRAVLHGEPVENVEALANPEALAQFARLRGGADGRNRGPGG